MAQDVDVLHILPLKQWHQGAAAHNAPDLGPELPLVLVGELGLPDHEGRGVEAADDDLGGVHELLVDDVGRQLLALQFQELLKEPLVRLLKEL